MVASEIQRMVKNDDHMFNIKLGMVQTIIRQRIFTDFYQTLLMLGICCIYIDHKEYSLLWVQ
jgi:hypothetical protein